MLLCFSSVRAFFNVSFGLSTAWVGYHIHHSIPWACLDGLLANAAWVKWGLTHEITRAVLDSAFSFWPK
jgi:hypothetical protein